MSIYSAMNDICTFLFPAEPLGGWDDSMGKYTVQGYAPCRLITTAGNPFIDGRIRNETTHVLFVITDLPVEPSWLVEVDERKYAMACAFVGLFVGLLGVGRVRRRAKPALY